MDENDPWLTNELAGSLQRAGNRVTVLYLDWADRLTGKSGTVMAPNLSTGMMALRAEDGRARQLSGLQGWLIADSSVERGWRMLAAISA